MDLISQNADVETDSNAEITKKLERFVLDNPDLERLESILGDFNPFVALRWTRQETRHSQFLRWMLDPSETHGLGAYFLRSFVKRVAAKAIGGGPEVPSVIEADSWDYIDTLVVTEWNNIDVLLRNDALRFVAVLENKVDTTEHGEQLQRYRELVEGQYPDYQRLFVFLTVEGDAPSDDAYVSVNYSEIASLVEDVITRRADQLGPEVRTFMFQYVEMLRRHIVEDSDIQELSNRIYQTHRRALDVIFEHRPDRTLEVSNFLRELIENRDALIPDQSSKAYVRFFPEALDFLPTTGEGWTRSGRLLLFEIDLSGSDVRMKCALGPGPQAHRDLIHDWVREHGELFNRSSTKLYPQWWSFHSDRWLTKSRFESLEVEDLKSQVGDRLAKFLDTEVPAMVEALSGLKECDWSLA